MTFNSLKLALAYLLLHPDRYIFPIRAGAKFPPLIKNNLVDASNDPAQIEAWVKQFGQCNWGLALKKSDTFVVDVDTKPGKVGQATFDLLDLEYGFPATERVTTPSGGYHLYYKGPHVFALGARGFGQDVDSPNYVIIGGCVFADGTSYVTNDKPMAPKPEWFGDVIASNRAEKVENAQDAVVDQDKERYLAWAIDYLKNDAPMSVEGKGGEQAIFKIGATLKENGISLDRAVEIVNENYNYEVFLGGKADPVWDTGELRAKLNNGYQYSSFAKAGGKTADAELFDDDMQAEDAASAEKIVTEVSPEKLEEQARARVQNRVNRQKRAEMPADAAEKFWSRPEVIDQFCYCVGIERAVCIERPAWMMKKTGFDQKFAYLAPTKGRTKSFLDSMLATTIDTIRRVDEVVYRPGWPRFLNQGASLNCYTPSDVIPVQGDTSWWDDHLEYLFPDPVVRGNVLDWISWLLQNMDKKPKHALLIQGHIQGTGKSFIPDMLAAIINPANVYPLTEDDLHNQFNGWGVRSKLLVIEELRAVERQTVKNKLHTIITQERLSINEKGIPQRDVETCFGVIAMTNHEAAVELDNTDRRYLVVRTDAEPRDRPSSGKYYNPNYYDILYPRLKRKEDVAAVAYALMNRDLKGYNGQSKAPLTTAKTEMIEAGMGDIERFIIDNKDTFPMNGRIIQINDIVDTMPARLVRGGGRLNAQICGLMKKHLSAVEAGQFRIGKGSAQTKPRLYVINRSGLMKLDGWKDQIGRLYEEDMAKAGKGGDDGEEARADFGEE